MAKKPLSELILPEITLLEVAARFFAALREREAHPLHASSYTYWDAKTRDELAIVNTIYLKYVDKERKLCLHPVAQAIADEWRNAKRAGRPASWDVIRVSYVEHLCKSGRVTNCEWHPDLTAIDIGKYIEGLPRKKMWWLPENVIGQEVPDVPTDPPADPPASPTQISRVTKGKAKAVPRGTKQCAIADPDPIEDSDDDDFQAHDAVDDDDEMGGNGGNESTPCKGKAGPSRAKELPQVEVKNPMSSSHSWSAPRPRIDIAQVATKNKYVAAVAVGKDMCRPCVDVQARECISQVNAKRPTYACVACKLAKISCTPIATWAQLLRDAISDRGHESHTQMKMRMSLHRLTLMVTDLMEHHGHDPTIIPGWNELPISHSPSPSTHSTPSLSVHSTGAHSAGAQSAGAQAGSSAGIGLAALTLGDAGSSHSSARPICILSQRECVVAVTLVMAAVVGLLELH
ncbi:hypothetical protein V8E53_012335 [Lactarius tabidus]